MEKKTFILLFLIFILCSKNPCQSASSNDFQVWAPIYLEAPIKGMVFGYFELNPRVGNNSTDAEQLLIRPAIGYKVNDHLKLYQGYAWIHNYEPNFLQEHRIWQQAWYFHNIKKLKASHRFRIEERFIENADSAAVRLRYFLRGIYPLKNNWGIVSYDEIFINANTVGNGPSDGFDQNRFFIGLRKNINKNFTAESGYQLQYINKRAEDRFNHIWLTQFFYNH